MPLRVALATPLFHPHVGGVESHVGAIASGLAARGHDVTVLTTLLPGTAPEEAQNGFRILRLRQAARLFSTPITPSLSGEVERGGFDLVHAHSPPPLTAYYAALGARRASAPVVLTYHCDLEIPRWYGRAVVRAYERTLGARTIAMAARVVATTRTYAQTSRALWQHDVDVLPNPVDTSRFRPDVDGARVRERLRIGSRKLVLLVARLTHHKGVEQFLHSARFTPDDALHVIVGGGPEEARIRGLAAPVGDKVRFAGRVAHADLPEYYAACDVAVMCSVSRLEAFGIAALEAMASGKPVVASDLPGVREVVRSGETGLLAKPVDARDLAAKITKLLEDRELAGTLGKRGRAVAEERYAVPRVVERLENLYGEVLTS